MRQHFHPLVLIVAHRSTSHALCFLCVITKVDRSICENYIFNLIENSLPAHLNRGLIINNLIQWHGRLVGSNPHVTPPVRVNPGITLVIITGWSNSLLRQVAGTPRTSEERGYLLFPVPLRIPFSASFLTFSDSSECRSSTFDPQLSVEESTSSLFLRGFP